jgi:hypothetical protein
MVIDIFFFFYFFFFFFFFLSIKFFLSQGMKSSTINRPQAFLSMKGGFSES